MKKRLLVLTMLISLIGIFAQVIELSVSELDFGSVNVGQSDSAELTITNSDATALEITIMEESEVFTVDNINISIEPNESETITITYQPETNILYDCSIFVICSEESIALPVHISAQGSFTESIYNNTYNKYDSQLKTALSSIIAGHYAYSYSDARIEIFGYIDNDNGQVRCVYTNEWYNCSPGGVPNWNSINTEHTWPQSQGASGDARSDLHHLFPTNSQANSVRGSLPFGDVVNSNWQEGGSKRGTNSSGQTVFEPRDDHKGDVARAMFYFAMRYNNPNNFLNSSNQQNVLRSWFYEDPVSEYEIYRNEEIEDRQNKPNPLVEHPQFLDRIANITTNSSTPRNPDVMVALNDVTFPNTAVGEVSSLLIPITNTGLANLNVSNISINETAFTSINAPSVITMGDWAYLTIEFTPTETISYTGQISVTTNGGAFVIDVTGNSTGTDNDDSVTPVQLTTFSSYPNPFKDVTNITFSGKRTNENLNIAIYNVRGQRVKRATLKVNSNNKGSYKWDGTDAKGSKLPSGVYFAKVVNMKHVKPTKILLVK